MIDLTTYALLRKQITSAVSGVSDVRAEGDELVFVLADGREVRVAVPATLIRNAEVRDDALVLTLADGQELVYTPTTTVVDATLTQSGQAADAKVTGDVVSQLKGDINSIIAVGKNLLNTEKCIAYGTGSINANTGIVNSEGGSLYIYGMFDLEIGNDYVISKESSALYVYFYDENNSYTGFTNTVTASGGIKFKTFNASYPKCLVVSLKDALVQKIQLEKGTAPTEYELFHKAISENIKIPIIGNDNLDTQSKLIIPAINEVFRESNRIDSVLFTVVERTYNLFDPVEYTKGYISSAGNIIDSSSFITTGFIQVESGNVVNMNVESYVCAFYLEDKTFIQGSFSEKTVSAVAPDGAKYFRCSWTKLPSLESANSLMVYIGENEKPFRTHYAVKKQAINVDSPYPSAELVMPKELYIATGTTVNINHQSVLKGYDVQKAELSGHIAGSITNGYMTRIVGGSTADGVKTYYCTPNYDNGTLYHKITIHTVPENAGSGKTKKVLFIGDSKTDANVYTQKLLDMFDADAMNIELVGTRGNTEANRHEGRSGWSARRYCTNDDDPKRGVDEDSPFYNFSTGKFDFMMYMENHGYNGVDYVFINLGTNDSTDLIDYYNQMISSIHAYDSNIIIGVWVPAPFATFGGYSYRTNDDYTFGKMKLILSEYDNESYKSQNVFVIPTHMNINTFYDFPWTDVRYNESVNETYRVCQDQIHESNGYEHDADVIFGYIKHFATLS